MIQANELRIGNWIQFIKVSSQQFKIETNLFQVTADTIVSVSKGKYTKSAAGIALTPEILIKAGFTFEGIGHNDFELVRTWYNPQGIDINQYLQGDYGFGYGTEGNVTELLYVHQLQNLFFALTGTELEVNL